MKYNYQLELVLIRAVANHFSTCAANRLVYFVSFSAWSSHVFKDEEVDIKLSSIGILTGGTKSNACFQLCIKVSWRVFLPFWDKCPELADVSKKMPQIANYLVRKASVSVVFVLNGLERKARREWDKTSLQFQFNASKSATKFECSVNLRYLNFDRADHTGSLSA